MKTIRHGWIDYARGIAIILVLYRHVYEGLKHSTVSVVGYENVEYANILFFSFRMPLFFIVSGFFVAASLQKRGLKTFVATKAKTILYPYFLWGIIQITLQLIFSSLINTQRTINDYTYLFYLPRNIEQFWYLYALFNVSILYAVIKVYLKPTAFQNIMIGLILFYASAIMTRNSFGIGFLHDIIHYYLFYAIGDASARFIREPKVVEILQSGKTLLILTLPFIATQAYFLYENLKYETEYFDFVENYQPFIFIFVALFGCAFIISLAFCLQKWKVLNWLRELGRHSLYIYVTHVIILASLRIFMTRVYGIYHLPVLLITGIVAGLVLPVLFYKLCVRLNITWLFSLEKREKVVELKNENS